MKIITWNCNMAFRKKAGHILAYKPDILVVPECEHPDKLKFSDDVPKPIDMLWFGENKNKGLGIFSYSHFKFKLIKTHNPEFKMIVPIAVTGSNYKFTLYAVWANNPADPDGKRADGAHRIRAGAGGRVHSSVSQIQSSRRSVAGDCGYQRSNSTSYKLRSSPQSCTYDANFRNVSLPVYTD